jgi:hypothetical protein
VLLCCRNIKDSYRSAVTVLRNYHQNSIATEDEEQHAHSIAINDQLTAYNTKDSISVAKTANREAVEHKEQHCYRERIVS